MKKIIFKILGMTCVGCAGGIEGTLKSTKGIEKAEVIFAVETANVEFDEKIISKENIFEIVKNMNYSVIDNSLENADELEKELKKKT